MSKIDFSQVLTAEARAQEQAAIREHELKAACSARIIAVLDERTLLNLNSAAIVGQLTAEQLELFGTGCGWISDMQSACRSAILEGHEPKWPDLPEGIRELASLF